MTVTQKDTFRNEVVGSATVAYVPAKPASPPACLNWLT